MRKHAFIFTTIMSMVLLLVPLSVAADETATEAIPIPAAVQDCVNLYAGIFDAPTSEPLAACQWDMALINANSDTFQHATGDGVLVGVIDGGVDMSHPDIVPNLNVDLSCSFIFDDTPTAAAFEIANGDCTNKAAVQDVSSHGTHVASTIAAPINGIGIAGVAPDATIVALKACTQIGFCFADSVAAALRYAGDVRLDIVNLSLFADPYLYYCKSDAEQRSILKEIEKAAKYAQQRGVLIVTSAGNGASDLQHPGIDSTSPDWPPGTAEVRDVKNNCRVAPTEFPGALTVSATGPVGYPGYDDWIATYSDVGMSVVNVTAPGGDYFAASGSVHDAILAAASNSDTDPAIGIYAFLDQLSPIFPGLTVEDPNLQRYFNITGTSMSSPHAAGVAALIAENHQGWGPGALKSAVERTASQLDCPPGWQPVDEDDQREQCFGNNGRTSFFGHGMVDAWAAVNE